MLEVVYPSSRDQVSFFINIQSFGQVLQEPFVHLLVIHKADGLASSAVTQTFFDLLDKCGRNIIIDIYLCILGDLKDPGLVAVITEIGKNAAKIVADDIFQ